MVLKLGDTGPKVGFLQRVLKIKDDEIFGRDTLAAVVAFQRAHGLVPDGYVGSLTIAALQASGGAPSSPAAPVTAPSGKGPIHGIDIYHGDDVKSWAQIAANYSFVTMKSSDGLSSRDSGFKTNWTQSQAHGLLRGPYHFMQWGAGTGAAQARNLKAAVDAAGGLEKTDIPPICDWEYYPERDPRSSDLQVGKDFLEETAQLFGRLPMLYSFVSMSGALGAPSWFAKYPLWIADPERSTPRIPKPWTHYTLWQTHFNAVIPGLGNKGDTDTFDGDLNDLKEWISKT